MYVTDSHNRYRKQCRQFVDEHVKPFADKWDRSEKLPLNLIKLLGAQGYLGALLPYEYGGQELDSVGFGLLNEALGRGCSSLRSLVTVHTMVSHSVSRWGTDEQKAYWLPQLATGKKIAAFALSEPLVGSAINEIEMIAEPSNEGYLLNGTKKWISFGQVADVFLVFARLENSVTAFLVDADNEACERQPITNMLGLRASMLAELTFKDCYIPKENLIGSRDSSFSSVVHNALDLGRYSVAWGCVGIAAACLDDCLDYINKRTQGGVLIKEHQLVQKMIADMHVKLSAAQQLCFRAGWLRDHNNLDAVNATLMAKYYASKVAYDIAGDAVQVHGANGYSGDYSVQRYLRDAKAMEIIEGSHEVLSQIISKNIYKEDYACV